MAEIGYQFSFTLTPEEALRARRRAQFFRLGYKKGIVTSLVVSALFLNIVGGTILAQWFLAEPDPGAIVPLSIFGSIVLGLVWANIWAATGQSRRMMPDGAAVRLQMDDVGIWIGEGEGKRLHTWDEFTALERTEEEYVVMTQSAYLAMPKRLVAEAERAVFEEVVSAMCLKRSPTHQFPVILNGGGAGYPVAAAGETGPADGAEGGGG